MDCMFQSFGGSRLTSQHRWRWALRHLLRRICWKSDATEQILKTRIGANGVPEGICLEHGHSVALAVGGRKPVERLILISKSDIRQCYPLRAGLRPSVVRDLGCQHTLCFVSLAGDSVCVTEPDAIALLVAGYEGHAFLQFSNCLLVLSLLK